MSYGEMVNVVLTEYVSDARQLQFKGMLETLRLRTFMKEKEIAEISLGLMKLVEHINELATQCPRDFRTYSHKIDDLRKALTEFQIWSRIPIQSITSQGYSFNNFVASLHESIQNVRQLELLTGAHELDTSNLTGLVTQDEEYMTHLTKYGRNPCSKNRAHNRCLKQPYPAAMAPKPAGSRKRGDFWK